MSGVGATANQGLSGVRKVDEIPRGDPNCSSVVALGLGILFHA